MTTEQAEAGLRAANVLKGVIDLLDDVNRRFLQVSSDPSDEAVIELDRYAAEKLREFSLTCMKKEYPISPRSLILRDVLTLGGHLG